MIYINHVLSHLGAWQLLKTDYKVEFFELRELISSLEIHKVKRREREVYTSKNIKKRLQNRFENHNWNINQRLVFGKYQKRYSELDAIKNSIGIEFSFGKFAFAESKIFVKFPLFYIVGNLKIAVLLMPMMSLTKMMPKGIASFELVRDRIEKILPLSTKFPLAICGLSTINERLKVFRTTSQLDEYLLLNVGLSLNEMQFRSEGLNYDFKIKLPGNDVIAKEACAMANLTNGGVLLFGINDDGEVIGFPRTGLNASRQKLQNIIDARCEPSPDFQFEVFEIPNSPDVCILILRILEIKNKPCMTSNRVYIRKDASSRPASSDEIRELVS